ATSATSVLVSWNVAAGAASYQVWRSDHNGAYTLVGTPLTNSFTDSSPPLTANTTYLYKVKSVDAGSAVSGFSNMDPATTILFTDDPLVAGTTKVKGIHLTEERTAVNAFRVAAGLLTVTFTDTVGPTLKVKAFHVNELRTA